VNRKPDWGRARLNLGGKAAHRPGSIVKGSPRGDPRTQGKRGSGTEIRLPNRSRKLLVSRWLESQWICPSPGSSMRRKPTHPRLPRGSPMSHQNVIRLLLLQWVRRARFEDRPPPCLHCHSTRVIRWGRFSDRQRYRCRPCGRTFSDLTGSLLGRTKRLSSWPLALEAMEKGASLRATSRLAGIHPSTAFRWRHQILEAHACRALPAWSHSIVLHRHTLGFVPKRKDPRQGTVSSRRVPGTEGRSLKSAFWILSSVGRNGPHSTPGVDVRAIGTGPICLPASPEKRGLATWIGPKGMVWAQEGHCGPIAAAARRAGRSFGDLRRQREPVGVASPRRWQDLADARTFIMEIRRWIRRFRGISADRVTHYLVWKRILTSTAHGYARVPSATRRLPRLPILRFLLPLLQRQGS